MFESPLLHRIPADTSELGISAGPWAGTATTMAWMLFPLRTASDWKMVVLPAQPPAPTVASSSFSTTDPAGAESLRTAWRSAGPNDQTSRELPGRAGAITI